MIGGSYERKDASTKMCVIGRNGRSSRLVADKLLAVRHCVATSPPQERDSAAGS
jgi:hypothetical protein